VEAGPTSRRASHELLKLLELEGTRPGALPHQLSGGQRQRVAIARALAPQPSVLLLDEPFGAVDAKIRQELREWLILLHHDLKLTTLFVTHDQEEAMEVSNRIVILSQGRLEQIGTPREVYEEPANEFVARFIGVMNVLDLEVQGGLGRLPGTRLSGARSHRRPKLPHRFPALRRPGLARRRRLSLPRRAAPHVLPGHHAPRGTRAAQRVDHPRPHGQGGLCAREPG
jgi:ABC-type sulfate/molybdate transport systems ATPase subunit